MEHTAQKFTLHTPSTLHSPPPLNYIYIKTDIFLFIPDTNDF